MSDPTLSDLPTPLQCETPKLPPRPQVPALLDAPNSRGLWSANPTAAAGRAKVEICFLPESAEWEGRVLGFGEWMSSSAFADWTEWARLGDLPSQEQAIKSAVESAITAATDAPFTIALESATELYVCQLALEIRRVSQLLLTNAAANDKTAFAWNCWAERNIRKGTESELLASLAELRNIA